MEYKKTAHYAPPAGLFQLFGGNLLAAVLHQVVQPFIKVLVERLITNDDIGLEVARADG